MTHTAAGDMDAIETAFDQAPVFLSFSEGEDLEVTACNEIARAVIAEYGDTPPAALAACIRDVATQGRPMAATAWRLDVQDATGRDVEMYLDFTLQPCFRPDGSVRGVVSMATDVTRAVQSRRSSLTSSRDAAAGPLSGRKLGISLQEALLPHGLPVPRGLHLAARYVVAETRTSAGGDWFDAVALDDGRVALVVGDVVGYGIHASVLMGELRTLFDERVRADGDIVAALQLLDGRARRSPDALATTVCAVILDPATGALTYCTAGHPPPLVVSRSGEAAYLPPTGAGPLGSGQPLVVAEHELAEGDLLLLYSDGVVTRPGRTPAQNSLELSRSVVQACARSRATAGPDRLVERVCAETLEDLTLSAGCQDDFSLLAAERVSPTETLDLVLPARPGAARAARAGFADWVAPLRVDRIDETAMQHSLGELVDNVVEHAYQPHEAASRAVVEVHARLAHGGVLEIEVTDHGHWREPGGPSDRGRGLAMVRGFSDELELHHDDRGTTARLRHRPSVPVELLTVVDDERRPTSVARVVLDVRHEGGWLILQGAVDQQSVDVLRVHLARASRGGVSGVRVDLTDVTVLASAGVQVLVQLINDGGPVELLAPMGTPAQHVLDLVRLPYRS